ncbi:MAG: CDP-glucose 4,6-dehydratase [Chlamydiales bacterium]|nr:CDP-glucose 4,6-dehydratase [Chlamydiales bacterium]MCH9635415.1 CDP-glucose 4,6-dehydratase [Chlamydiales bacterium]MCH9703318.1 GDP-mannose 4,6-dehydratase [Chlamydiota bacterium]
MGYAGKRVFITGATGLVGRALVEQLLDAGASVCCLVRDPDPLFPFSDRVTTVSGSLEIETIERALCEQEIEVVFHLAAQTLVGVAHRAPLLTFESNVRGSYLLLEACRRQAAHLEQIVVASSDKAYGTAKLPYTEETALRGDYPYDVSKTCTDLITRSYFETYRLPISIVRCGNIYGGGDLNWSRIVPGTIRSVLENKSPLIRSDGTLIRDYFYVKDAASAYMELGLRPDLVGEAFNFGSTEPCSVLEITDHILKALGSDLEPHILNEAKGEIKAQYLDCTKANRELNWEPRFTLEEGLEETIEWYRNFLNKTTKNQTAKECAPC